MELLGTRPAVRTHVPLLLPWLLIGIGSAGCSQIKRPEQADQSEKVEIDELLHEQLQNESMVTVAEAYRVMLVLADGEDRYKSFEERQAALEGRGLVRPEWGLQRDDCIDKGSVAYMVCKILNHRGGLDLALLGAAGIGDRRYALRELVDLQLTPSAPAYRYITGAELVDLAGKADRYMAAHGMYEKQTLDMERLVDSAAQPPPGPAQSAPAQSGPAAP